MSPNSISEDDIESFLNALRAGDADKKVNLLQLWGIKLESATELPERGVDAITLLVGPFLRSPSHLLVTSTLSSFLPEFIPLIPTVSSQPHLRLAVHQLLPGLVDKLNDPKDRVHEPAKELIAILGQKCYAAERADPSVSTPSSKGKDKDGIASTWENAIKDLLAGRGARAKVGALKMLQTMREDKTGNLPLKPWLPSLVNLLEDSDGGVRDQARETVVALLSPPAPSAARSELKKLMLQRNVRKSIADGILSRVLGPAPPPSAPAPEAETTAAREGGSRSGATTPAVVDEVPIVYIASAKDMESEFRAMVPHMAGKETEHNWGPRERDIVRIRGMLRGKAFSQMPDAFLLNLRGAILEGIGKTLLSLRTTVAQNACALVQELAEELGSSFDPFVEQFLPTLGKMAGFTKRIIAERSQKALEAMIRYGTAYRILLNHIVYGVQEKSVQTRQYSASHLTVFLNKVSKNPSSALDNTAVDQLEQAVKKCLADVNPQVREQARTAFWTFDKVWPKRSAVLIDSLDPTARKQLEKANPGVAGSRPTTPAKPTVSRPRASAAILAAKRAKAAELAAERAAQAEKENQVDGADAPAMGATPAAVERLQRDTWEPVSPSPAASRAHPAEQLAPETPIQAPRQPMTSQLIELSTPAQPAGTPGAIPVDGASISTSGRSSIPRASPKRSPSDFRAARTVSGSSVPRAIASTTGLKSASPSMTSDRSMSPNLARTLSRSPPSLMESMHQTLRDPAVRQSAASSETSAAVSSLRTPVQQRFAPAKPMSSTSPTDSYSPSPHGAFSSTGPTPLGRNHQMLNRPPIDAADEARRAQVAQGLQAAQQLIDFDDDEMPMSVQQPLTPARAIRNHQAALNPFQTPRNGTGSRVRQSWEDSPKVMTPKVLKRLEGRNSERNWWIQHRDRLEQIRPIKKERLEIADAIKLDVEGLSNGQPSVENLQRLTIFSEQHKIPLSDKPGADQLSGQKEIWEEDKLFDCILRALLAFLEPHQPQELLEWGLVLLWELAKNQWVLFENEEDAVLDTLFRLRTRNSSVILEYTNALMSLLADVCDTPFLLSLLHSALDRYLHANPIENGSSGGDSARAAGYSFGLNAMGMCILHLPKEAVEVEAKRLQNEVAVAVADDKHLPSRQAAYGVIQAVQAILCDDVRTLSLFPKLNSGQRSFATYLMKERGLLGRANGDQEGAIRRETVLEHLVEGMSKVPK